MFRAALYAVVALIASVPLSYAARKSPVSWTATAEPPTAAPGAEVVLKMRAEIEGDYHVYSLTTPAGGPIITTTSVQDSPAVQTYRIFEPKPHRKLDPNFNLETETFDGNFELLFPVRLKSDAPAGPVELSVKVRYQACNDRECLPPTTKTASATVTVAAGTPATGAWQPPAGYQEVPVGAAASPAPASASPAKPAASAAQSQDIGTFLLLAFGFGLAAVFTPCVFPMIPITVSFFLNQSEKGGSALQQAAVFCLGIVFLFTAMGIGVTAVMGPFGVVQLGSNPWVNGFIAAVFFAFALSLLGAFELTLPSSMLTKLDRASQRGGFAGTLLMGLTFSLTSFACVGPFVGPLLASSVQGARLQPILGMATFATGLATPFFLLSLFPSYLQKLPRSGGWLARVKIVLGFVLLAAVFKYLSNVDQVLQSGLITRERFLAAWFVLFTLAGLYLLGFLRLEGIKADEKLGLGRMLTAAAFLIFAVSLLPGMFGARLGELEGAIPPPGPSLAFSGSGAAAGPVWMKNQYAEALAKAKQENKLVLVNFTGYACTNCHWMKANMFTRPAVAESLKQFVLLDLYTDGTDDASKQNQDLQDKLFQSVAIPYYAILDGDGKVVASFAGLTRDEPTFLTFLKNSPAPANASL